MAGKRVHLVGIGGVGMSALAQAYVDAGWCVSGSDRALAGDAPRPPALAALAAQGVRITVDDASGLDPHVARLVVSTAIEADHPERARAREWGIPVVHRAAALAELLAPNRLVAVAGTCGKSTVTAILAHVLTACGFDPVVVNGAEIVGWNADGRRVGATRAGGAAWAIAEVDESDKSLTAFSPYAAIVTNASADHYSKEEMDRVFDDFVASVPGPVVDARTCPPEITAAAAALPMPGAHNRFNAACALKMAYALGADPAQCAAAIKTFPGVVRRMEKVGVCGACDVYDDYAHNPEKIAALWRTLADAYPRGVLAVWRPHGYGPLRKMLDALAAMFAAEMRAQDALLVLPVYDAGGTAARTIQSDALVARVPQATFVKDLQEAEQVLRQRAPAFGALVTVGARDPGLPVLARRLVGKE